MALRMLIAFIDDVSIRSGDKLFLMFTGIDRDCAKVSVELEGLDGTQEKPRAEVIYLPTMDRLD